jgi:transcriptional regulator GlxA family with amidase domain
MTDAPRRIGFLLLPQFSMMAFASALEPLRVANRLARRDAYRWTIFSADGAPVPASNGLALPADAAAGSTDDLPMLITCAGFEPLAAVTPVLTRWFRRLDRAGAVLGGIDTGSFALAAAGLLDGYRATAHWEALDGFAEKFPRVEARACLFETDRRRLTCAGGTAALDLMLQIIRMDHGAKLAAAVSEQFIYNTLRHAEDRQRLSIPKQLDIRDARLARMVEIMERNVASPVAVTALARTVDMSPRQVERLFAQHLGKGPQGFYQSLRLQRARSMVQYSDDPLLEVAIACGFGSYEHFCRSYRKEFAVPPSRDRRGASS